MVGPVNVASIAHSKASSRYGVVTDFKNLNLHSAAARGNIGLVTFALTNGQPVNSLLNGILPIHAAAAHGNQAVVLMLIEHGADVNAIRLSHKDVGDKKQRAKEAIGTTGSTPLHFAASNGHAAVAELLLAHGARPDMLEKNGLSPADLAMQQGHENVVEVLRNWEDAFGPAEASPIKLNRANTNSSAMNLLVRRRNSQVRLGHRQSHTSLRNLALNNELAKENLASRLGKEPKPLRLVSNSNHEPKHGSSPLRPVPPSTSISERPAGLTLSSLPAAVATGSDTSSAGQPSDLSASVHAQTDGDDEPLTPLTSVASGSMTSPGSRSSLEGSRPPQGSLRRQSAASDYSRSTEGLVRAHSRSSTSRLSMSSIRRPNLFQQKLRRTGSSDDATPTSPTIGSPDFGLDLLLSEGAERVSTIGGRIVINVDDEERRSVDSDESPTPLETSPLKSASARSRHDSIASTSSSVSRRPQAIYGVAGNTASAERVMIAAGTLSRQSFAPYTVSEGNRTRSSSTSTNSQARHIARTSTHTSSSPASSYFSNAASLYPTSAASTNATSQPPTSPHLPPVYETAGGLLGRKADSATTSAHRAHHAQTQAQEAEQALLKFSPSQNRPAQTLAQQLAAYSDTLAAAKKFKAEAEANKRAGPSGLVPKSTEVRYETLDKVGTSTPTVLTQGERKADGPVNDRVVTAAALAQPLDRRRKPTASLTLPAGPSPLRASSPAPSVAAVQPSLGHKVALSTHIQNQDAISSSAASTRRSEPSNVTPRSREKGPPSWRNHSIDLDRLAPPAPSLRTGRQNRIPSLGHPAMQTKDTRITVLTSSSTGTSSPKTSPASSAVSAPKQPTPRQQKPPSMLSITPTVTRTSEHSIAHSVAPALPPQPAKPPSPSVQMPVVPSSRKSKGKLSKFVSAFKGL
ncbi:hypothetical protein E5Q_05499 [Mixia osmundae IAM 14324]|uniref:protein S-acyltransferase n=1 Tax=Mixia osmundae (strain CBS 9802 / IAM 14324 / JCM 22182 / KY 12970) TaxID=764103 RepID=G7E7K1_MIXOS|nr:hypothetical protein E5Q_05499 [Mixia osmundae IAM 14324]